MPQKEMFSSTLTSHMIGTTQLLRDGLEHSNHR